MQPIGLAGDSAVEIIVLFSELYEATQIFGRRIVARFKRFSQHALFPTDIAVVRDFRDRGVLLFSSCFSLLCTKYRRTYAQYHFRPVLLLDFIPTTASFTIVLSENCNGFVLTA